MALCSGGVGYKGKYLHLDKYLLGVMTARFCAVTTKTMLFASKSSYQP